MGFTVKELKQDPSVVNVQLWMLKKFSKDEKPIKRKLLLNFLALVFFSLVIVSFVKYSQSSHAAMPDRVLGSYAAPFIAHSALAIKN